MPTTCGKCRRANPAEAAFCYHDGAPLSNGHAHGAPVAAGRQAFARPFAFPSGRQCRTFDELALGCQQNWKEARGLLEQGLFEQFLGGLGRADLARAAREAARSADKDRGLDDLLDKLPTDALDPPRLVASPQDVHLGVVPIGSERRFDLHLENRGMRLLRGSVTCVDTPWLAVGDGGALEKLFQFGGETLVPVRVQGKHLRAGGKPLEGRLVVDSNGGQVTVVVRADVPVKPFPEGVLAGATTPRQIAERAKAAPKEAAYFFEKDAVARWYTDNGWTYPVQGPTSSGLGAVQQFFEALGLTPPPKVEVSVRNVNLSGTVGERLDYPLEVRTPEKRPVYASAISSQPWLKIGRVRLDGRAATIPLVIPSVPDRAGEKLQAEVTVTANGNQHFAVAVALAVEGRVRRARPELAFDTAPAAVPVDNIPVAKPYAPPPEPVAPRRPTKVRAEEPRPEKKPVAIPVALAPRHAEKRPVAVPLAPGGAPWWAHLLPLLALFLALLGVFAADTLRKPAPPPPEPPEPVVVEPAIDPTPRLEVRFHDTNDDVLLARGASVKPENSAAPPDGEPAVWEASMRFGVVMAQERKRLTFEERGLTNNTVVRLDNREWIFGENPFRYKKGNKPYEPQDFYGRWKEGERDVVLPGDGKAKGEGHRSVWVYPNEKVEVTQFVELVAGEQSRQFDTYVVRYVIDNQDARPHKIGLRFLLDTFIGGNDGVPFTVPGQSQLCDTRQVFSRSSEVPDFLEALEQEDLADPGTVARVQLRLGGRIEAPARVTLGAWPNPALEKHDRRCRQEKTMWEVPVFPIKTLKTPDSAVVMYWVERNVAPGEKREVGFAYGLGRVASGQEAAGRLGLSVGGRFVPGGEFTLTALVSNPKPGEKLTLTLPEGFKLSAGSEVQDVPPPAADATRRASAVTWKIKALRDGSATLQVQSTSGAAQEQAVRIRSTSIFD